MWNKLRDPIWQAVGVGVAILALGVAYLQLMKPSDSVVATPPSVSVIRGIDDLPNPYRVIELSPDENKYARLIEENKREMEEKLKESIVKIRMDAKLFLFPNNPDCDEVARTYSGALISAGWIEASLNDYERIIDEAPKSSAIKFKKGDEQTGVKTILLQCLFGESESQTYLNVQLLDRLPFSLLPLP